MTSLTFLGTSGGTGTTTLAALSVLLLVEQGSRIPTVVAEDAQSFDLRLGTLSSPVRGSGHELVDGGRYQAGKAAAAIEQGRLVLVGASTPQGVAALESGLSDVAQRFGAPGVERTLSVLCSAFGRSPAVAGRVSIPFDTRLAVGAPLTTTLPSLRPRTKTALNMQWLPVVRETYGIR